MLAFLVVIYFLSSITIFFTNNIILREIYKSLGKDCNEVGITDNGTKDLDLYTDKQRDTIKVGAIILMIYFIVQIMLFLINFFVLLAVAKHDNLPITIIFLVLTIIHCMYAMYKSKHPKEDNNKDKSLGQIFIEQADKLTEFKFSTFFLRVLNLAYYAYAIYVVYFQ